MNRIAKIGYTKRVLAGRWLSYIEASIYLVAHTAMIVATGYYLWHPAESQPINNTTYGAVCNDDYTVVAVTADSNSVWFPIDPCTNTVNVYQRFTIILRCYFAFFIIQWARTVSFLITLKCRSEALTFYFTDCTGTCQCCFAISLLVVLHVFRFQSSGMYVSGDYMTYDQLNSALAAYRSEGSQPLSG